MKPRALVDVLTPKQVLFYAPIAKELESRGFEVLATTREYREIASLAERARFDLKWVGKRGDKGKDAQLVAATERQAEMIPIIRDFRPNVVFSTASAVLARVAFGLGIDHVAVNDSPHSLVAGKLSIPLSGMLLCPWVIPFSAWAAYGIGRKQVKTYRALDAAAWLKRDPIGGPIPKLEKGRKTIVVRVPETDAPYLASADKSWGDQVLSSLADEFSDFNLIALCRYGHQVEDVKRKFGKSYIVPEDVVDGRGLLERADLFVGMGGTMNAEAALLGVPTISSYQGELYTDNYLRSKDLLTIGRTPKAILFQAKRSVESSFRKRFSKKARQVLASMEDPVPRIADAIQAIASQA